MMGRLHHVPTPALERLLDAVRRGELRCPATRASLAAAGLSAVAEDAFADLEGLDAVAVQRVVSVLVAERLERDVPKLDLVWTGPEPRGARSRDTAVLVRDLFANARQSVLIAGFAFDHGAEIFAPLHGVLREHGVECQVFLDIPEKAPLGSSPEARAEAYIRNEFLGTNWPFGPPFPAVYYDPTTATPGTHASLHAKCIVADLRRVLITSANFTDRGQTRNLELGVLIEDRAFAEECAAHWRSLVADGLVKRA